MDIEAPTRSKPQPARPREPEELPLPATQTRCRATLFFADIVGYSRHVARNQDAGIELLAVFRRCVQAQLASNGGVLVEVVGDGVFARFDSPYSAVRAAVNLQRDLDAHNEDSAATPLLARIGLHTGTIVICDDACYGDAVNIAARLEPLAVPAGICLSREVYDAVRPDLSLPLKRLGTRSLHNIQQPVRCYLIKPTGICLTDHLHYVAENLQNALSRYRYLVCASLILLLGLALWLVPKLLLKEYGTNYVEVADFNTLIGPGSAQSYISRGVTEVLRAQLADMDNLYVVHSEEGVLAPVRVEGTIQKTDQMLRIAYQVVRRSDNVRIDGGRLDGETEDIFILQDRLVGDIARALAKEFDLHSYRPPPLSWTGSTAAFEQYLKGSALLEQALTDEHLDSAIEHFYKALEEDPGFAKASVGLCQAYADKFTLTNDSRWIEQGELYCDKAAALDPESADIAAALGVIYRDTGRHELAEDHLRRARKLDPQMSGALIDLARLFDNTQRKTLAELTFRQAAEEFPLSWYAHQAYGAFLLERGHMKEALDSFNRVLKLTPHNTPAHHGIGTIHYRQGEFRRARRAFTKALKVAPRSATHVNLTLVHIALGNAGKARESIAAALRMDPQNYALLLIQADILRWYGNDAAAAIEYYELTVAQARSQLQINPRSTRAMRHLAVALAVLGDGDEARTLMAEALNLDPESIYTRYQRARMLKILGDDTAAVEATADLQKRGFSRPLLRADPDLGQLVEK